VSFTLEYAAYLREFVWLTLIVIFAFLFLAWLVLRGTDEYSIEDANAHAEDFGGVIAESHGPVTFFLWVSYAFLLIWTLAYLWVHRMEFLGGM